MAPASRGKGDVAPRPRTRSNRTVVARKTAPVVGSSTGARIPIMDEIRVNGSQAAASASASSSRSTSAAAATSARRPKATPAFEMVVLGSGGGPLETDCSGYLVKPLRSKWEDGVLALEGGSGMGALASLFREQEPKSMFPDVTFPPDYNTPVLKAAYIFSFLTCYLITHAHMDHNISLILLSGSVPPRASAHPQPPLSPVTPSSPTSSSKRNHPRRSRADTPPPPVRPPVFATRHTLEKLSMAYGGELWPELGSWAQEPPPEEEDNNLKRRKLSLSGPSEGSGVVFSPMTPSKTHRPLHPALPISTLVYPVMHGCTSKGSYESSAVFVRYDPAALSKSQAPPNPTQAAHDEAGREFLFFGDVESAWRPEGDEDVDVHQGQLAQKTNEAIWAEAARSFRDGRLAGVFIECSYDSTRPQSLMFGHLSPPGLYHELKTFAGLVNDSLGGLKIYVIHIKENLAPHPSGRSMKDIIMSELRELEEDGQLGVEFVQVKRGDRILI